MTPKERSIPLKEASLVFAYMMGAFSVGFSFFRAIAFAGFMLELSPTTDNPNGDLILRWANQVNRGKDRALADVDPIPRRIMLRWPAMFPPTERTAE